MIPIFMSAPSPVGGFDLNDLISGGAGASLMAALIFVGKLILDRTIPSRSDHRANVTIILEGLNNMVKVLQEEKNTDIQRLADKRARIEALEAAAGNDYDRISELRSEIIDLRNRLAQKDRHINTLVAELRKMGAEVIGLDGVLADDIEVTMPPHEIRRIRSESVKNRASSDSAK